MCCLMRKVNNLAYCYYLIALCFLTSASGSWAQITDLNGADFEQIRIESGVASYAVLAVEANGSKQLFLGGVKSWDEPTAVTAQNIFRIGSVSKLFTGLALLKAEALHKFSLNRPIAEFGLASLYDNPWRKTHPLTTAHLMEHTAGWFDMSAFEFNHNDAGPLSLLAALQLRPASRVSHWPPGTYSEYSNSGAGLAAYVLEQAIHQDFEYFTQQQVLQPLGMRSASYRLTDEIKSGLVQGYDRDGKNPIPYWHIVYRPAGGLNVRPAEMFGPLLMLLNRGRYQEQQVFSAEQIERLEMPTTTLAAKAGLKFGYGLGIYHAQFEGHTILNHGGDADGYLSHFAYYPQAGRGYFVVVTAFDGSILRRYKKLLNEWLIAKVRKPPPPSRAQLASSQLDALAGTYYKASTRFPRNDWRQDTLKIRVRDNRLSTQEGGQEWRPLLPVSGQFFRRPWETTTTAVFIKGNDGSVVLQGGMGNWRKDPPASISGAVQSGHEMFTDK